MKQEENWAWKQRIYGQEKLMLIVMARQSNGWIYRGSAAELSQYFGEPGPSSVRKAQRLVATLLKQGYVKRYATNMSSKNTGFILNQATNMTLGSDNSVVITDKVNPLNEYINTNINSNTISNSPIIPSKVSLKEDWATIMSSRLGSVAEKKLTESFIQEINSDYQGLPLPDEAKKFALYWTDGKRKLKNFRLAWRNWLDKNRRKDARGPKKIIVQRGGQTKDPFKEF